MRKRRGPAGRRRTRGGQGRTVNFRYGTPRKAGSGRRDKKASPQVAAPEDDSFLLPSSCPTPLALYAFLLGKNNRENCEERQRLSSPTKVSLKIRETLRSATLKRKRVLGSKGLPLVKTAVATLLIGCSHRNCSPTRNLARRKYDLMCPPPLLFFYATFMFFYYLNAIN